jgi:hypothetical protein
MTPGQAVVFAVGLSFLVFLLAGDFGFQKVNNVSLKVRDTRFGRLSGG